MIIQAKFINDKETYKNFSIDKSKFYSIKNIIKKYNGYIIKNLHFKKKINIDNNIKFYFKLKNINVYIETVSYIVANYTLKVNGYSVSNAIDKRIITLKEGIMLNNMLLKYKEDIISTGFINIYFDNIENFTKFKETCEMY